jgi:DNA polymerase
VATILRLDVESYSGVDLKKAGAAKYFASPDFELLLTSYKYVVDGVAQSTVVIDHKGAGEYLPQFLIYDLQNPAVIKSAWNAAFEIGAFSRHLGIELQPESWHCTMVHALASGLPGDLAGAGRVMKATRQKDFRGSALIRFFCCPVKATKKNGMRTRNLPKHDPERWALFRKYNSGDVEAEHVIAERLERNNPLSELEWQHYVLDHRMNNTGVKVDLRLIDNAIALETQVKERLFAEAIKLTGLANPNSVAQLKTWLSEELDEEVETLNKESIPKLISMSSIDDRTVAQVLGLRQQLGKSSVSKYHAMKRSVGIDGRIRGLIQFMGAGRTGRAAGRLVQVHNLRKNALAMGYPDRFKVDANGKPLWHKSDELSFARELLLAGDFATFCQMWDGPLDILSQLIRTAILPDDGRVFCPVDFSAIEARWLAWAADEKWRLDVFRTHGEIYEASAAAMFNIPLADITKASPYRAKGKVAELALGYQGGEGALIRMGALDMGLKLEELNPLKDAWRAANLKISGQSYKGQEPGIWEIFNDGAIRCVRTKQPQDLVKGMRFRVASGTLFLRLPSDRELAYVRPTLVDGDYGPEVNFWGQNQMTKQWEKQKLYGGRAVENADQASSRDLLYHKLLRLEQEGLHHAVRMHIHDEVVPAFKIDEAPAMLEKVQRIFNEEVPWAPGLPLRGDGFTTPFFRKDD